jgi:HD-GYP domain-containing protein (c-di-GMP phosphodiesterase class II)
VILPSSRSSALITGDVICQDDEKVGRAGQARALADAIEAMSSDRPYRQALSMERIIEEIQTNTGKQFDPQVVEAFMKYIQMESNQVEFSQDSDHQRENIPLNGLIERFNPTG